jgi:hypothetical protein
MIKKETLTKKQERIIKRKERLECIALEERAFCLKHEKYLCVREIREHHCYNGDHGKKYCQYLEIQKIDDFT